MLKESTGRKNMQEWEVSKKKFDVQDSSSSNDKYNERVGIAKILKINERACTLFKHLRVTRLD